jgi:hypothetical protein
MNEKDELSSQTIDPDLRMQYLVQLTAALVTSSPERYRDEDGGFHYGADGRYSTVVSDALDLLDEIVKRSEDCC